MGASCNACTADREKPLSPIPQPWGTGGWPNAVLNWGESESDSSLPPLLPSLLLDDSPLSSESDFDPEEDAKLELKLQMLKRANELMREAQEARAVQVVGTSLVPIVVE
jgi:hypothetical protein